jgi:glycine/D-amino acid oxidase-like deaminating enzyme/nitrite reductase/ring-hydroxylating ferredoxin subunit
MNSAAERTRPLWLADTRPVEAPPLAADFETDIAVVGAGIAGMTAAYLLARAGRQVVVLDAGAVGGGMTGRTTAHLSNELDDRWSELLRLLAVEDAALAAAAHSAAIDRIEAIQREARIDCDFARVDGYLFLADGDPPELLDRELEAARRVGLADVHQVERAPIPLRDTGPALCFPRQARLHPLKYLAGLASAVRGYGGRLFGGTRVVAVHDGTPATVETSEGRRVRARSVVVATNTPVNDRVITHTKQAPYRTYVVAAPIAGGAVTDALYWDTADPYHYVRTHLDHLVIGGEDHKTGQASDGDARFRRLEQWARERFPIGEVDWRWSGQVMEPVDYLGFIGRNPGDDNIHVATGDSGMGMTHGTIAGMVISDLILARPNRWARVFDVRRLTPKAGGEFMRENLNVAIQYARYVTGAIGPAPRVLHPGQGAVQRHGLRRVAAYRDPDGVLHQHSAVCPHMGCLVAWNPVETCWDCPCHGSQFAAATGEPLNGPACRHLARIDD